MHERHCPGAKKTLKTTDSLMEFGAGRLQERTGLLA